MDNKRKFEEVIKKGLDRLNHGDASRFVVQPNRNRLDH